MRCGGAYCGGGDGSIFNRGGYLTAWADTGEAGDFSVTGDSGGYSYADNVLTIESAGEYTITMASGVSSTSADRIVVDADGAVELTISDISITSSADAPFRADGGDLTLILEGDNYLTASGTDYEALSKTSGDNKLTITSCDGDGAATGSLTATGGFWGAGIGGGMSASGNNIEIAGGTINAEGGGSAGAAGIGGGYWGNAYNILISGGVVNATGNGGAGIGSGFQAGYSSVTITGGYVNAVSGYGAAIGGGDRDYGTTAVSISGGYIKTTTGGGDSIGGGCINSTSTKQIAITGGCFAEGNISADTVYDIAVYTGYQVVSNTDSATSSAYPYMVEINDSDMSDCAFIITGSDISLYEDYTYKDNVLIIKKGGTYRISMNTAVGTSTTTDRIVVYADSAVELTICDIDITSSTAAAFRADAGDLTLVLEGDNYLTSGTSGDSIWVGYAGIAKESASNSLKITSCEGDGETEGSLTAIGGYKAAGIGGGTGNSSSDITISGGTVTATGSSGTGIGGGSDGSGSNITISGGTVTATGGSGAGIGGSYSGSGSNITISGGTVTATGSSNSAGIGGGGSGGSGSNITISGGTVTATGSTDGAGIGGGYGGSGSNITISDGTVTATGESGGAGIGGGYSGSGSNITISGGTVTASSSNGAGIGGGRDGSGSDITISGGIVEASGNNGAGIGGGYSGSGSNITISGGTVTASGSNGAGIGGGYLGSGSDITISGGTVEASGSNGAGIGGGRLGSGSDITINGGTVEASGNNGAGIGGGSGADSGAYGNGSNITISGGYINTSSSKGDCIGNGYNCAFTAENISISGGSFAVGSTSEGTVYGIAVKSPCSVTSNLEPSTKADYPYFVTNFSVNAFVVNSNSGSAYTYENNVLTLTESGLYDIKMNTDEGISYTQTDRIVVDIGDDGIISLKLSNVNILSSTNSPLSIKSGEVYIELDGDNYLTATYDYMAALSKKAGSGLLWIRSGYGDIPIGLYDTLTAQSGRYGAAIGGDYGVSVSDIQISSGTVTAISGAYGAAIGGGYGGFSSPGNADGILITGGVVTAASGGHGAGIGGGCDSTGSNITITGGTVTASSAYGGAGIGGGGGTDYGVAGSDITISGGYIKASSTYGQAIGNGYAASGSGYTGDDPENVVITGGYFGEGSVEDRTVYTLAVDDSCSVELNTDSDTSSDYPYVVTEYTGDLVITGTDITKGTDYKYSYDGVLTILKSGEYNISMASGVESTSDRIVVDADGDVELTITDINIINEDNSPFSANSGNLTLILDGDNYLTASSSIDFSSDCINYAALSKPGDTYSLTITSIDGDGSTSGSLTASGALQGAGIGGGNKTSSGNITIAGGTVTATGGMYGAGIGGGQSGGGTDITITGGNVTASSNTYGAGIGGGYSGEGSNIEITGGTVNATSDTAAGIGGGAKGTGSDITISGGDVTATSTYNGAGIGGGEYGEGNNIIITGGTVNATSRSAAGIGGGYEADGSGITITGGNITASSSTYGAAIGGGEYGNGTDITISGGYITAVSPISYYIGGGYYGSGSNISITGGYFGKGDTEANTVYGVTVETRYIVVYNTDTDYPYAVIKGTDLVIKGDGDIAEGTEYTYDNCVLTVLKSGAYTITMASWAESTSDRIVVDADGDVELTITDINIINEDNSPFSANSGNLTLILDGDNYLTASSSIDFSSDSINYAALSKPGDTYSLTITSVDGDGSTSGSLTASGAMYGAGIGGGNKTTSGNITIAGGTITATGGIYSAGIGGGQSGSGTGITITGGNVTALSSYYGAGIGGGYGGEGSNIEIIGGTVDATGSFGAGIGGGAKGTGSNITISGGDVTATSTLNGAGIGGGYEADGSGITITGGNITASSSTYGAAIGGGEYGNGTDITISGGYITAVSPISYYIGGGYHGSSSNISITGGYFGKGDTEANTIYKITLADGYTVVNNTDADTSGDYPYTIEKYNALVITGDGDIAEGTEYTYDNYVLTVLKSGAYTVTMASWAESTDTDRIVVNADGDVELTIRDINITSSSESPISADSGNLTLILDGDNYLTSTGANYAAISKAASNTLEITSADGDGSTNGSLTADGGKEAAAIGGDRAAAGNNITISGGTVNAVSDQYGAGIGGGRYAGGSNITITGGDVTASSTNMGAGIGGGQGSNGTSEGSNITISGGKVTAASSSGAGIGGGYSSTSASVASGITISGGFVTATSTRGAAIGSGTNNNSSTTASSSASGIKITGGTITANGYYGIGCGDSVNSTCEAAVIDGGSIKAANGFTTSPVNSAGSSVYLYELTDTTEGEAIYIDGSVYIQSVVHHESEDTSQYLYLPETSETGLVYTSVDTAKYYDLSYENETSSAEYKGSVVLLTVDGETQMLDGTNNVDTSGITVAEENGVLSGIQVDTEAYGGENGTYLDIVGVSIDGVFYQLENYYYTDDSEQYAFFPVTRNSSESKESKRVRGAVGTKPNGADDSNIIYYITEGSDGLTIKEKSEGGLSE